MSMWCSLCRAAPEGGQVPNDPTMKKSSLLVAACVVTWCLISSETTLGYNAFDHDSSKEEERWRVSIISTA